MIEPTQVFEVPLPRELAAQVQSHWPKLNAMGAFNARPEVRAAKTSLDAIGAVFFDGMPWLVFDGELRQLSGGGRLVLPRQSEVLAAVGLESCSQYRLLPAYRVGDRQLWFAWGYGDDEDSTFIAVPLVFASGAFTPLVNGSDRRRRLGGTSFGRGVLASPDGRVLLLGEIDAGAAVHADDFIMVDVAFECDLARGRWRDASRTTNGSFASFDHRLLTAHADHFLVDRESTWTTDLLWKRDPSGRLVGTSREKAPRPLPAPLVLTGPAPSGDYDARWGLVHASWDGTRALALDLLRPDRVTVSLWTEL